MDRGHRALLSLLTALGCGSVTAVSAAPQGTPGYTPSIAATPGPAAPAGVGKSPVYGQPYAQPQGQIYAQPYGTPYGQANPFGQATVQPSASGTGAGAAQANPAAPRNRLDPAVIAERIARMSPEEKEVFQRNLRMWQQLPPEERMFLRQQAQQRNREEIQNAMKELGVPLSEEQREIFALRYLQERRKLERELEAQAAAERSRRLPQIIDQLRREFGPGRGGGGPGLPPGVGR